jgi:hypothetical protein
VLAQAGWTCPFASRWFEIQRPIFLSIFTALAVAVFSTPPAAGQETCQTSTDMDAATQSTLTNAAAHYYDLIAKGDSLTLRQNSIPSLAADFSAIESTIKANQAALGAARPSIRPPFLLTEQSASANPHAEFFCGVFGRNGQTADSAVFYLSGLAPGKYGVVIADAPSAKTTYTVSEILELSGSSWKLGGLYIEDARFNGHDSNWFINQAEAFQKKGEFHDSWLYYVVARSLISPLPFMSTAASDKLYDDSQKVQPADFPENGKTAVLAAGTASYKLTALFPEVVGNDLDLIVKYEVPSVADSNRTYQNNVAVMKALLTKYPELGEAFASVVARAVEPSGRDYGTMLAMKDIK